MLLSIKDRQGVVLANIVTDYLPRIGETVSFREETRHAGLGGLVVSTKVVDVRYSFFYYQEAEERCRVAGSSPNIYDVTRYSIIVDPSTRRNQ